MMTIEIFSIANCPNHQPTVERVKSVLSSESLSATVIERIVGTETEADSLRFAGSPTVLVNGEDLERHAKVSGNLACRIYTSGGGIPSYELVRTAIQRANRSGSSDENC
jgi:hypothetical protein